MIKFNTKTKVSVKAQQQAQKAWQALLAREDLGFWQLPQRDKNWQSAQKFANQLKVKAEHLVVVGLGGSALGGRCLVDSLGDGRKVDFLFNTDVFAVQKIIGDKEKIKFSNFLFISKSGGTLELACILDLLLIELKKVNREVRDAISVITEEKSSALYNWAVKNKISILAHPQDVGGRFSAFTGVGLVPAIFAGVNVDDLRDGVGRAMKQSSVVIKMAAYYFESFLRDETISVFWSYIEKFAALSPWLVQLWAESLAKKNNRKGKLAPQVSTPIAYMGTCDQHSVLQQLIEGAKDKSICFLRAKHAEKNNLKMSGVSFEGFSYLKNKNLHEVMMLQSYSTEEALRSVKRHTAEIEIDRADAATLAELMMSFELLIGVLGEMLNINAFDQPGVEIGKKITKEKLQKSIGH